MNRASLVVVVLAAWLGAAVLFAAVVAPAAFAVLPSRTLAGELVGRVLPVIFVAGIIVAFVALWLDAPGVGRLPHVRRAALIIVAVACGAAQFVIAPRIERTRREIGGPIEQLAPGDSRRIAFGRLHAVSVAWLGLAMLAAGTTLALVAIAPRTRRVTAAAPLAAARG